jgi:Leucine-rich repeat (LRR) protein
MGTGCCMLYSFEQELNMSGLRLDWIADSTFSELKNLRLLDLRDNSLRQIEKSALASQPALQEVYLSGKLGHCCRGKCF